MRREDESLAYAMRFILVRFAVCSFSSERIAKLKDCDESYWAECSAAGLRPLVDQVKYPSRVHDIDCIGSCKKKVRENGQKYS